VALPGVVLYPQLARHQGALQTNRGRRSLECRSTFDDHDRVYGGIQPDRQTAHGRRRAIRDPGICGHAALAILFQRALRSQQQFDRQRQPHHESLFPEADHPGQFGHYLFRGFRHLLRADARTHGVLPVHAFLADHIFAPVYHSVLFYRVRHRAVPDRAQREVPRLPLHHSVHRAVRPIHIAGGIQQQCGAGTVPLLVQPQSDGRRDRRVSLVYSGGIAIEHAECGCFRDYLRLVYLVGSVVLPEDGTEFRGCHLVFKQRNATYHTSRKSR